MVKLRDIAKRANVSNTAVSFALNNKPGISDETRSKILDVAKEMNFRFKRKQTNGESKGKIGFLKITSHGLILNRDHDVFISDYISGINAACREHNYEFNLIDFKMAQLDEAIADNGLNLYDGVIILGTELSREEAQQVAQLDIPMVFLDTFHDFVPNNFVTMNNADAIHSILHLLHCENIREVDMITSDAVCANLREREQAFVSAMKTLDLDVSKKSIHRFPPTFTASYQGVKKLLQSNWQRPQALVCANDIIALGCIRAAQESGLEIPKDISITGFDNLPSAAITDPGLTSYDVPKRQIGRAGMQTLLNVISANGRAWSNVKMRIDGELVIRQSVGAP